MNKRIFSPEQGVVIRYLLNRKSETPESVEIVKRLDSGQMSFEEADDAIRFLGGIGPAADFWNRLYPKGGATIAAVLEPHLDVRPIGPPLNTFEVMGYKAIGCPGPSTTMSVNIDLCSLNECHEAEGIITTWFDEFLRTKLKREFLPEVLLQRDIEGSGARFLQEVPLTQVDLLSMLDVPSQIMRDKLQANFAMILSAATAAYYFQKRDLWDLAFHALKLFKNGNPISGFTSNGTLLIVADVYNERHQSAQPRYQIPSPTPVPPALHPNPTPVPSSSPTNTLS